MVGLRPDRAILRAVVLLPRNCPDLFGGIATSTPELTPGGSPHQSHSWNCPDLNGGIATKRHFLRSRSGRQVSRNFPDLFGGIATSERISNRSALIALGTALIYMVGLRQHREELTDLLEILDSELP